MLLETGLSLQDPAAAAVYIPRGLEIACAKDGPLTQTFN